MQPRSSALYWTDTLSVNTLPAGRVATAEANLKLATAERKVLLLEREVSHLKRREGRYKDRLEAKGESLKDALGEAQEARTQTVMAEERIDTLEALLGDVRKDLVRYKGWWLTEYHSMKVVIGLLPDPDYVHDIAMSSKARFETYSASL